MVGSQTRSDFTRDPCPWRLVEDMGGAYSLGLAGGTIWQGGKSVIKVNLFFLFYDSNLFYSANFEKYQE